MVTQRDGSAGCRSSSSSIKKVVEEVQKVTRSRNCGKLRCVTTKDGGNTEKMESQDLGRQKAVKN
jgi:hypothetical protein